MPICITGMHRSGTSMVARLLNLCGLYLGEPEHLVTPTPANPKGYWENRRFVLHSDRLLARLGGNWFFLPELSEGYEDDGRLYSARLEAAELLADFIGHDCWGWKDPRASLLLRLWRKVIPDLKVVVCVRNPLEVVRSLYRRQARTLPREFLLELWGRYYSAIERDSAADRTIYAHYGSFFLDAEAELRRLLSFAGIECGAGAVHTACDTISASLRHGVRTTHDLLTAGVERKITKMYLDLCAAAGPVCASFLRDEPCSSAWIGDWLHGEEEELQQELLKLRHSGLSRKLTDARWSGERVSEDAVVELQRAQAATGLQQDVLIVALASVQDLNEEILERLAALFPDAKLLVFRPGGPLSVKLAAEAEQVILAKEDFNRGSIEQRLRSVARENSCAAYVVPVRNYLGAGYEELIAVGRKLAKDKTWVLPPDGVPRPVGPWLQSLAELRRPARRLGDPFVLIIRCTPMEQFLRQYKIISAEFDGLARAVVEANAQCLHRHDPAADVLFYRGARFEAARMSEQLGDRVAWSSCRAIVVPLSNNSGHGYRQLFEFAKSVGCIPVFVSGPSGRLESLASLERRTGRARTRLTPGAPFVVAPRTLPWERFTGTLFHLRRRFAHRLVVVEANDSCLDRYEPDIVVLPYDKPRFLEPELAQFLSGNLPMSLCAAVVVQVSRPDAEGFEELIGLARRTDLAPGYVFLPGGRLLPVDLWRAEREPARQQVLLVGARGLSYPDAVLSRLCLLFPADQVRLVESDELGDVSELEKVKALVVPAADRESSVEEKYLQLARRAGAALFVATGDNAIIDLPRFNRERSLAGIRRTLPPGGNLILILRTVEPGRFARILARAGERFPASGFIVAEPDGRSWNRAGRAVGTLQVDEGLTPEGLKEVVGDEIPPERLAAVIIPLNDPEGQGSEALINFARGLGSVQVYVAPSEHEIEDLERWRRLWGMIWRGRPVPVTFVVVLSCPGDAFSPDQLTAMREFFAGDRLVAIESDGPSNAVYPEWIRRFAVDGSFGRARAAMRRLKKDLDWRNCTGVVVAESSEGRREAVEFAEFLRDRYDIPVYVFDNEGAIKPLTLWSRQNELESGAGELSVLIPRCVPARDFKGHIYRVRKAFPGRPLMVAEANPQNVDSYAGDVCVVRYRGRRFTRDEMREQLGRYASAERCCAVVIPLTRINGFGFQELISFAYSLGQVPAYVSCTGPHPIPLRSWLRKQSATVVRAFVERGTDVPFTLIVRSMPWLPFRKTFNELTRRAHGSQLVVIESNPEFVSEYPSAFKVLEYRPERFERRELMRLVAESFDPANCEEILIPLWNFSGDGYEHLLGFAESFETASSFVITPDLRFRPIEHWRANRGRRTRSLPSGPYYVIAGEGAGERIEELRGLLGGRLPDAEPVLLETDFERFCSETAGPAALHYPYPEWKADLLSPLVSEHLDTRLCVGCVVAFARGAPGENHGLVDFALGLEGAETLAIRPDGGVEDLRGYLKVIDSARALAEAGRRFAVVPRCIPLPDFRTLLPRIIKFAEGLAVAVLEANPDNLGKHAEAVTVWPYEGARFTRAGLETQVGNFLDRGSCAAVMIPMANESGSGYEELLAFAGSFSEKGAFVCTPSAKIESLAQWTRRTGCRPESAGSVIVVPRAVQWAQFSGSLETIKSEYPGKILVILEPEKKFVLAHEGAVKAISAAPEQWHTRAFLRRLGRETEIEEISSVVIPVRDAGSAPDEQAVRFARALKAARIEVAPPAGKVEPLSAWLSRQPPAPKKPGAGLRALGFLKAAASLLAFAPAYVIAWLVAAARKLLRIGGGTVFLPSGGPDRLTSRFRAVEVAKGLDAAGAFRNLFLPPPVRPDENPLYTNLESRRKSAANLYLVGKLLPARLFQIIRCSLAGSAVINPGFYSAGPPILQRLLAALVPNLILELASPLRSSRRLDDEVRVLCRRARRVVCATEEHRRFALACGAGETTMIETAVDTAILARKHDYGIEGRPAILGWIGNPHSRVFKGRLLPLVKRLGRGLDFRLRIFSSGFEARRLSDELLAPQVEFVLWRADQMHLLAGLDIGLVPQYSDPRGGSEDGTQLLLLAGSAVPVIASPVGRNENLIRDGENGLLADSLQQWVEAVERLIADRQLRAELGAAGRRSVEKLKPALAVDAWLELLAGL